MAPAARILRTANSSLGCVAAEVMEVGRDITAVHDPEVASHVEWSADVVIIALESSQRPVAGLPDCRWRIGLVVADILDGIGSSIGYPEERHICAQ